MPPAALAESAPIDESRVDEPPLDVPPLDVLRARVVQMQGRPAAQPVHTHPALSGLLQMQTGGTYGVESATLAMLLLAGPSSAGGWCAVVGCTEFGLEAAAGVGVDLSRTIVVPDPGEAWLEVVAALVDVLGVVLVRPPAVVSTRDAARLSARLRQRGSILVGWGDWPRCEARLSLTDVEWDGLGSGHGHLRARQATVEVRRGAPGSTSRERSEWGTKSRRLWLPDADLRIRAVEEQPPVLLPDRLRSVS